MIDDPCAKELLFPEFGLFVMCTVETVQHDENVYLIENNTFLSYSFIIH